jgi:hypothetical protein
MSEQALVQNEDAPDRRPQVEAAPSTGGLNQEDPWAEFLPVSRLDTILEPWLALSDQALDDNPFLSPAFLLPLVQHDLAPSDLLVCLVWRRTAAKRQLIGFLPIRPSVRKDTQGVFALSDREAQAWTHAWQPISTPLLARDETLSAIALRVLLKATAGLRQRPSAMRWPAVPAGSACRALLERTSAQLGLDVQIEDATPATLGLEFRPMAASNPSLELEIAARPADVSSMLERLLVLEAEADFEPLVDDAASAGLVRAMARGLAARNRLRIALTPAGPGALGAIVVVSRSRAWLWRLVGAGVGHPPSEAALILAVERALGLPVSPASGRRLTGIGLDLPRLENIRVELRPGPSGIVRRLGERLRRGAALSPAVSNSGSAAA